MDSAPQATCSNLSGMMSTSAISSKYISHEKKGRDRNSVWFYFLKESGLGETALCKQCKAVLKTKGGSTKGLLTHLQVHNIALSRQGGQGSTTNKIPIANQQKSLEYYYAKDDKCLDAVLARITAVDGFPFKVFIKSKDLRQSLEANGLKLPKSQETIKNHVMKYYQKIRENCINELELLKSKDEKFCLIFDEWTSTSNKHYININVHGQNKFWNLGLVRYKCSLTAEVCVSVLETRLQEFKLYLSTDIVAVTTDGASTMVKVGKLITPKQQLCMAHGIQLAVIDVLYQKQAAVPFVKPTSIGSNQHDSDSYESFEIDSFEVCQSNEFSKLTENNDIQKIVSKVRTIVRTFRKSPMKNDNLQKYIKSDLRKEYKLILDCKTRWSSLFDMLERFLFLQNSIKKAMIDINMTPLLDCEFMVIKDIVNLLQPIKITVEALCQRDMNLIKADAALNFMLKEIRKSSSVLGINLCDALVLRIKQRRTIYSGLLNFLNNSNESYNGFDGCFKSPSISIIKHELECLLIRLSGNKVVEDSNSDEDIPIAEFAREEERIPLKLKLQRVLEDCVEQHLLNTNVSRLSEILSQELELFINGGNRGRNLQRAYNFLLTVPPTSVESERCFSSAGYICNKIRSSLADDMLDALLFLRSHFSNI